MQEHHTAFFWGGLSFLVFFGALWGVFEKAGRPGWFSLVPVLNGLTLMEIVGRPRWWVAAVLVPGWNLWLVAHLAIDLARSFGKTARFGLALIVFGFVLVPLLAFGSAHYVGPAAAAPSARA